MSIALTHVLTIGIATILIAMLLMAGSTMLDAETERSTETALETVGERLAGDIDNVDRSAAAGNISLVSEQPQSVAGSQYTVTVLSPGDCGERAPLLDDSNHCLELTANSADVTVHVPFAVDNEIDTDRSISGGTIEIAYDSDSGDDELTMTRANR